MFSSVCHLLNGCEMRTLWLRHPELKLPGRILLAKFLGIVFKEMTNVSALVQGFFVILETAVVLDISCK